MVNPRSLSDELVVLRDWDEDDADWYAAAVRDPEIQRFTAGPVGEVSYWVATRTRGRGVATAALRLLSNWAPATLGLSELRPWCHADNVPSRRVAERAGYRRARQHDGTRTVKGQPWPVVGYALRVPLNTARR